MTKKYEYRILELRGEVIELPDDAIIIGVTVDGVIAGTSEDWLHYLTPVKEENDSPS